MWIAFAIRSALLCSDVRDDGLANGRIGLAIGHEGVADELLGESEPLVELLGCPHDAGGLEPIRIVEALNCAGLAADDAPERRPLAGHSPLVDRVAGLAVLDKESARILGRGRCRHYAGRNHRSHHGKARAIHSASLLVYNGSMLRQASSQRVLSLYYIE